MKCTVVDPGGDLERILVAAGEYYVEIEKIPVTHGHDDHSGNAAELAAQLDVPIEGRLSDDFFWIDMMIEQGEQWVVAGAGLFEPTRWLDQSDSVSFGNLMLVVLHCSGHTPGHQFVFDAALEASAN